MSDKAIDLGSVARELIKRHGGLRPAARALQVSTGWLAAVRDGMVPSDDMVKRLGVRRVTRLEWIEGHGPTDPPV